jgi:lactate permease
VAFGALGIPIIVAGQVTGIDAFKIGAMAGRQLPLLSVFVPFWLVFMMDGLRGVRETWPAALVAGLSFAVTQYFTSNFIGPELPDITSALVSLISLTLFLKVWQPKRAAGAHIVGAVSASVVASTGGFGQKRTTVASPYSLGEIFKAWSPFLILTVLVTIWTLKPFKAMFAAGGSMYSWVFNFAIPHLDQMVIKIAPIVTAPTAMPAVFKLDPISATGTAIFFSALISMLVLKINVKTGLTTLKETFYELRWPILSIGMVLAFAFVTNYSGMSSTMALVLAGTGAAFPFFSPFLGWLGVFLTGSDTSSNALFSSLQATTAHQIGVSDVLLVAANTSGGVTGKMISPQSIAVACAATGLVGKESDLFRFTLKHSLFFATIVGLITLAQAYWFTGMLVH